MEITHIQKNISSSPRKLRLVADVVRKNSPIQAIQTLRFVNKGAADPLAKAIKVALANATQKGLDPNVLNFKALEVNEAMKMKRVESGGRGRRRIFEKKTAHVRIVLTDETNIKDQRLNSKTKYKKSKISKEKGDK